MVLAVIMTITALPQLPLTVQAATGYASLSNLGNLGTVNIGSKTESGTWYKTHVNSKATFCMDLGKACHSGDVYVSETDEISSDSKNKKDSLEAKIGYWYSITKKKANKAWVYAQCLIWSVEENCTSESELKDVIKQVRNNTGYYDSQTVNEIYKEIFDVSGTVTCSVTKWTSSANSRQVLMEITSGLETEPGYKTKKISDTIRYRQRITLHKTDEDNNPLSQVEFTLEAKNIKELYSYKYNGWGSAESGETEDDESRFVADVLTDSNGKITFRFDYKLQSEDYYYCKDEDLKDMSNEAMKDIKQQLDDEGYKYAKDLSKSGAEELIEKDLEKQLKNINNKYILKEVATNNENIIAQGTITNGMTITIDSSKSWTKEDGAWPDTSSGKYGAYEKAYQVNIVNNHKKVKFTAVKKDDETGTAQGDASLAGAVYGMYEDKACTKLMKQYTTDANGQFETDYVRCGVDVYLKEITPPTGYLKNDKVYTVKEDGQVFNAEYNKAKETIILNESVVKGNVEIIKIKTNGAVGITQPEFNAEFQIYLASAGSYDKAKAAEKDYLVTNADGYTKSKDMPYGTYIVHQTKGDEGTEYVADFYVDVTQNGKTYKYILNNPEFTAYLKVVKKDAQTKQTVLKAGTTYQIFKLDEDGNETIVKQSYNNGNKIVVADKFVSDESGEIITYKPLGVGTYRIRESVGPEGTYNDGKFVDIEITDKPYKTMKDEDGNEYKYAECVYYNNEAYGKFTVEKKGPSVNGFNAEIKAEDSLFDVIPVNPLLDSLTKQTGFTFEDVFLNDVVFELYAKEDIVTQDNQGTNWFDAGEKVAVITIGKGAEFTKNSGGICSSSVDVETGSVTVNIPLGKYELREVQTKYGFVLPETNIWDLEFKWNSQTEEYVYDISGNTTDGVLTVTNDLPTTDISVIKKDAMTEVKVPDTVFGFYTKDNIYDKDGNIIVNAGEKICTVTTGKDGVATVPFSVPVMSEGYGEDANAALNSGDYFFIEEFISDSYYIEEEPIFVHLEYKDQDTKVVKAEAVFTNMQTDVEIDKLMIASSVELPDCHLYVKDKDNNEIISWISGSPESVIITEKAEELGYKNLDAYINEKGNIIIKGLLHDMEYTLSERKPADGYVTASDIKFMLVKKVSDEGVISTETHIADEAGNYIASGSNKVIMYDNTTKIEFSKTDITGEKEIPGCDMEVTEKESGEVIDSWTSTGYRHMVEGKFVAGKTYVLTEKRPADGFVTAESVEFTVADTGAVQQVSMKDDTTKIKFSKIASDTKKLLPGAEYAVYDSKGKKVYEFVTTDEAIIIEGVLAADETYTFVEEKVPDNYKKADDVKITVKDTGKVQKIKVIDERIPEVPNTPQTGGNRYVWLWALLAVLGFGTAYSCIRINYRKKPENEE